MKKTMTHCVVEIAVFAVAADDDDKKGKSDSRN